MSPRLAAVILACLCSVAVSAKIKPDEAIVEIKCLIPQENIADFSKKLHLESKPPLTRVVCFFDTESQSLFQHNPKVVLRSRYDSTNETDTTVKIREGKVQGENVECEFDEELGKDKIPSCSVTKKGESERQIKKANIGHDVKKIFSKEREATLLSTFGKIDWHKLKPYGPVKDIRVWKKIRLSGGPDLTVEQWKLPACPGRSARVLFEVSTKVALNQEAKASKWLADLVELSETGSDQESETKTRIVMEHFKSDATR